MRWAGLCRAKKPKLSDSSRGDDLSSDSNGFSFAPLGILKSCYKDKFGVPRQSGLVKAATARLELRPDLQPEHALAGLEGFSHVWLIWVFHENRVARYHPKVHPPRLGGDSIGVFATRSPHRPNPIGLSLVEIVAIENGVLFLSGVDLMDGTPILDLKPYLPEVENVPNAREGWAGDAAKPSVDVKWAPSAEEELKEWRERLKKQGYARESSSLRDLIEQTILQDPRPLVYRGDPRHEDFNRRVNHAFRLYDGDVHFRMLGENEAEVFKILQMHDEFPALNLHKFAASTNSAATNKSEGSHGNDCDRARNTKA